MIWRSSTSSTAAILAIGTRYNVTVVPQVQDAFLAAGVNPVLDVELRVLDVIGFTRVLAVSGAVPAHLANPGVSGANFEFNLLGTIGSNYIVQVSTNLLTWQPLSTNTIPGSGSASITNTNALSSSAHRFYRAVVQ